MIIISVVFQPSSLSIVTFHTVQPSFNIAQLFGEDIVIDTGNWLFRPVVEGLCYVVMDCTVLIDLPKKLLPLQCMGGILFFIDLMVKSVLSNITCNRLLVA